MSTRDELLYKGFPLPCELVVKPLYNNIVGHQEYLNDLAIPSMNLAMFDKSRNGAMRAIAKSKRNGI